jgi:hypothetical protein
MGSPLSPATRASGLSGHSGTTAYGLTDMGEASVKLKIVADGSWTIKIATISTAPVLPSSASGKGAKVFRYESEAVDVAITHKGQANFTVQQYCGDLSMGRQRDRQLLRNRALRFWTDRPGDRRGRHLDAQAAGLTLMSGRQRSAEHATAAHNCLWSSR